MILSLLLTALQEGPIKAYVLAGQSNMQGHGMVKADPNRNGGKGSFEWYTIDKPELRKERDDVDIWYLDRSGKLRPGYGHREGYIGPELGFGHVVGDDSDDDILLIKVCWGGKSLGGDFRPPSAGGTTGSFYKQLIDHVTNVRDKGWNGRPVELAGFGWHQGWNDRVNQAFVDEYEVNMVRFIRDIRKDLDAPGLPFVIAESGMTGLTEKHPRALKLMRAQAAATRRYEWEGTVGFCRTQSFWREKENSPTGQGYHWNSNAETYWLIGQAMGREMLRITGS